MSKVMLLKIVGVIAVVLVFAGSGIFIWIRHHQDNPVAEKIEKVLPVRVNPLLAKSNEVYWFYWDVYLNAHENTLATHYQDCYYRGGNFLNADVKKELIKGCRDTALRLMKDAKKRGYFVNSTVNDWLDQKLMKRVYEEFYYKNNGAKEIKKYEEPEYLKKEGLKLLNKERDEFGLR